MPRGFDAIVPNAARVYDYWLDGFHNFAVDREMANKIQQAMPTVRDVARIQRSFLRRVVLFMADSGIRRSLTSVLVSRSSAMCTRSPSESIPECRIVYVDKESVAVAHSELLLQGDERTVTIQANLRDVEDILDHPQLKRLLTSISRSAC